MTINREDLQRLLESGELATMVSDVVRGQQLHNAEAAWNYLKPLFASWDKTVEHFVGVFLDAKGRVLNVQTLATGSLTQSAVYPREVLKEALRLGASSVIFAHNHPSGDPEPSIEDKVLTRRLIVALEAVQISVHDHIVLGGHRFFSFADNGLINSYQREFKHFLQVGV